MTLAMLAFATSPPPFTNQMIAGPLQGVMAPCEPSIAISLKDPNVIIGGAVLDRAMYTSDGGKNWQENRLKSPYGVYGDPTLISDINGHFYYFHLSNPPQNGDWIDRIVCQKSKDGGRTWSDGIGIGHNPPADQDKQWAVAHPSKPWLYVTWTQFEQYGSRDPLKHSDIMFSGSTDGADNWSKAVRINDIRGDCLDGDNTTEGAVPAVTSDGTIHVVWSNHGILWYDRSKDGGKTWLPQDRAIASQYGGWDMTIPGIGRCNGMPVLMADPSSGANKGNLYILFADQRMGVGDTDIFLMRSTDGGEHWSQPTRVNRDPAGKQQFFPWLAVDHATGYLYAVYYDRRAYDDNQTDVYVAWSVDGGKSFKEMKISEKPFTPTTQGFFGDYNNISAHKGVIAPIWTRMDNNATTVWTAIIKHADLN